MRIPDSRFQAPNSGGLNRRSGLIAVVVIVILVLIALIGGSLLAMGAARRSRLRSEERQIQAEWLAESGLERASAKLAESGDYRGETWQISADDLGGRSAATVRIEVEADSDRPGRRTVKVRAEYPADSQEAARRSKQAVITAAPERKDEEGR